MVKKFTLFTLLLCISLKMFASHLACSEISYAYNGTNYTVTVKLFRDCAGIASPSTVSVVFNSANCGYNFSRTLNLRSVDSNTAMYCASAGAACNSSSAYPMRQIYTYSDTVTLAACNDWKISNSMLSLNASITNLSNPSSNPLFVEAFLDNSVAPNSNTVIANLPPFILGTNNHLTVPLQGLDPDNDSINYQFIPTQSASNTNISWASPNTLSSPMGSGSSVFIDQYNADLVLYSPNMGLDMLTMRTYEYRMGALVGYSTRSWDVIVTSLANPKVPLPDPSNVFTYITHPGQTQTITMTFNDSTATDSVFVGFTPTNTWSYSTTSSPAAGTGSGSITWTTPTSLNPATTPYFYIYVPVHDNSCPYPGRAFYTIIVYTAQGTIVDSVWPGDANSDNTANMYDALAVAVAYGDTGAARSSVSNAWTAQYCANWTSTILPTSINTKHADCNGDGAVNLSDLAAISANYGLTHPKQHGSAAKTTGVPDLYFDLSGIVLSPGANVSIPIKLGTAAIPMNNIYGLATNVNILGAVTLTTAASISYPTSWLGTVANTLNLSKNLSNNQIDWAYARTTHTNTSGSGTLANLNFSIPATATAGQMMKFHFNNPMIIDSFGNPISPFNALDDSLAITVVGIGQVAAPAMYAEIVPNPSAANASIYFTADNENSVSISITDMLGKSIWKQEQTIGKGYTSISLPATSVVTGIYFIQIKANNYSQILKWIKE